MMIFRSFAPSTPRLGAIVAALALSGAAGQVVAAETPAATIKVPSKTSNHRKNGIFDHTHSFSTQDTGSG